MYRIHYATGEVSKAYETTQECLDALEGAYPNYWAGHDGDLADGGDRTLVWRNEAESENDDGANAVASIRRAKQNPAA
jgi:hypothetical protein